MHPTTFPVSRDGLLQLPTGDPRRRATFGPLRILALDAPREYCVGSAMNNDFVLRGDFAHYASRRHCKLTWDGEQMSITDLESLNGTWVNKQRLAHGEVRLLRDQDQVAITPLALDGRLSASHCQFEYMECKLGGFHTLVFVYKEYSLDSLETTLTSPARAVRRSLAELQRIRKVVHGLRLSRIHKPPSISAGEDRVARTYTGSVDRPGRPETPFYIPPLPIDLTPELHRHKPLRRAAFLIPGPEDPDGFPADHPDIIWRKGLSYKHVPGTRAPSYQMQQWSCYYNLPVGLHCDWPLFSSVAYGARPPPDALPPRAQREEVFANYHWPKDEFTNKSCYPVAAVPARPSLPPTPQHGSAGARPGSSSRTEALRVRRTALPSPSMAIPASPTIRRNLKRPRSPDDATIDRPAKRVAVSAILSAHPPILSSPLGASPCRTSPPSDPRVLSMRPVATTPSSHTAPDSVQVPSPSARARTRSSIDKTLCIHDVPGAAHVANSHARKRKREDDADADATAEDVEILSAPVVPAAQPDDAPSAIPQPSDSADTTQHLIPRKRRRIQPSAPIRRSLRVREKAGIGKHKSFQDIINSLDTLPATINATYIDQSSYWLTFFPLRGFLVIFDLAQIHNLVWISFKTHVLGRTPRDHREYTRPQDFEYAAYYANLLFMGTIYINRVFHQRFRYYTPTEDELRVAKIHSERADIKGNRLEKRFGHPVLHAELFTPMLHANTMPLLAEVYHGKIARPGTTKLEEYGDLEYDPALFRRDRGELDWDQRSIATTAVLGKGGDNASLYTTSKQPFGGREQYLAHGPGASEIERTRFDNDKIPLLPPTLAYNQSSASLPGYPPSRTGTPTPRLDPDELPPPAPYQAYASQSNVDLGSYQQYPPGVYQPAYEREAPMHRPQGTYSPQGQQRAYSPAQQQQQRAYSPAPPPQEPGDGNMAGRGARNHYRA
ncbi:unnamed protein product [Peniophora sp. CBMAI 1063]|nr:unnamed protein product [Peniophora sp. CBMAI 1063]